MPSVLWEYRTTVRTPTRETPFRLAYKSKAVTPVEVRLISYRVDNYDERRNNEAMCLQLDLVNEVRTIMHRIKTSRNNPQDIIKIKFEELFKLQKLNWENQ